MRNLDLRPLSIGEILDRTFSLYRQHFLLFLGISAIPHVITLAFGLLQILVFQHPVIASRSGEARPVLVSTFGFAGGIAINVLAIVIAVLVYLLSQGGTISAVSELYLGRTTTITEAFRRTWSEIGSLFGVVVLNVLATAGAALLLIIPGIYVACRLLVCLPAAIVEGRGPRESLSRSWDLTKGYAGRSAILLLLYVVISLSLGALVGSLLLFGALSAKDDPAMFRMWLAINQVLSTCLDILIVPILLIGTAIFYFDLRVRKEAFDLQFLMDPTSERVGGGGPLPSIL